MTLQGDDEAADARIEAAGSGGRDAEKVSHINDAFPLQSFAVHCSGAAFSITC
jgi:hypothetical protein